jgi:cell wall-associated NlpC family hydrolase
LRHAFAVGAMALMFSSSVAIAQAEQPANHLAVHRQLSTSNEGWLGVQAPSPDVATWVVPDATTSAPTAMPNHGIRAFARNVIVRTSRIATELTRSALRFLGTPYVFGGSRPSGFDCSGYTQHVFAMVGLHIPRMADGQFYAGTRAVGGPRPGDLVFFQTYLPGPSHVGIYLGHGHFVHASSSHGVMVSSLSDSYWSSRYIGAKRYVSRHSYASRHN